MLSALFILLVVSYYLLGFMALLLGEYEDQKLKKKDLLKDLIPFHALWRVAKAQYDKLSD